MYIRYEFASAARPDTKRVTEKAVKLLVNMVEKSPKKPHQLAKITALTRPIRSPNRPKIRVPHMEPTKKKDWPTRALYAASHTQLS